MNNYYINKLAAQAKKDMTARWRLGELLAEADAAGKKIVIDKNTCLITIKENEK
ncbi:MAG: hypothetical protein IJ379_10895 [Lachnospiraceae bacterium]|nr:hypothetical protein [Lachnospiraceae bacterium]